ncbi:unnamed protein product [Victoria cruziana]
MKAVNSEAKPIYEVARDVAVKVESWSGKANFSVAPMDDLKIISGMEFMCKAKMVPMPHLKTIGILDEKTPCMIQAQMAKRDKGKALMLLAIQLKKGLKHGDDMFLVAIREVQGDAPGVVPEALVLS